MKKNHVSLKPYMNCNWNVYHLLYEPTQFYLNCLQLSNLCLPIFPELLFKSLIGNPMFSRGLKETIQFRLMYFFCLRHNLIFLRFVRFHCLLLVSIICKKKVCLMLPPFSLEVEVV